MPKFFCDYCDVYLTHDSMSVRKAHNSGRNHLRNVVDYYQQIGQEKAQSVIDSITDSYAAEGQASSNPMLGHLGGAAFGPPGGFVPGGMPPLGNAFPPNMPPMPFPAPNGRGMPLPQGFPPGFPALPTGFPPNGAPPFPQGGPPAGSPLGGIPFHPPGGFPSGMPPGFMPPDTNGMPGGMNGGPPGTNIPRGPR